MTNSKTLFTQQHPPTHFSNFTIDGAVRAVIPSRSRSPFFLGHNILGMALMFLVPMFLKSNFISLFQDLACEVHRGTHARRPDISAKKCLIIAEWITASFSDHGFGVRTPRTPPSSNEAKFFFIYI